jgi:NADPH:quinone reductase-like Zn-dependent oxidoreductase
MRAVVFAGVGGPEVMRFEERPDPTPGTDEVLVAQRFAALNPADLVQRAGNYPPPPGSPQDVPGLEVCGEVVAAGAGVQGLSEGDRVFGLVGGGGLADRVVAHYRHVARVPDSLGEEEAAAAAEAFITAHDAIVTQAGLGLGDVLLVNGANGGVGLAAVQLGVAGGARVFASARSARERLAELGPEVVAPAEAFDRIKAEGGADVVLELVGAPNLASDLGALAMWGRVVVIGTGAGAETEISLRALLARRGRILGSTLRARPLEEKARAVQAFAQDVVPLLANGRVKAIVDRVFPAEQAAEAFEYMTEPGKFGKILLAF